MRVELYTAATAARLMTTMKVVRVFSGQWSQLFVSLLPTTSVDGSSDQLTGFSGIVGPSCSTGDRNLCTWKFLRRDYFSEVAQFSEPKMNNSDDAPKRVTAV